MAACVQIELTSHVAEISCLGGQSYYCTAVIERVIQNGTELAEILLRMHNFVRIQLLFYT